MIETAENPLLLISTTPTLSQELQRDRLLIKEKLLRHSRRRKQQQPLHHPLDDENGADDDDENFLLRSAQHHQGQHSRDDDADDEEEAEEESLEAMHHALTNHPMSWWAMRKQWQTMRRNGGGDAEMANGVVDSSYRRGNGTTMMRPRTNNNNLTGHPVLLVDPSSLGYETSSYRNRSGTNTSPLNSKDSSSIIYVSRETFLKRKILHMLYLVASFCFIIGGMFVLEQRKLSHYALVESPISLSAYLAGEELVSKGSSTIAGDIIAGNGNGDNSDVNSSATTLGGESGLMACGKIATGGGGRAGTSNTGLNPSEQFPPPSSTTSTNRFEILKSIFVNCGVTPAPIFNNPASAQYRALHWMAYDDDLQYKPVSEYWIKKLIQRYALVALYYATNGEEWKNQLYFLSNRDECSWNRVYETYFSGAGHCKEGFITALALWGNSLDGGECFKCLC